MIFEAIGQVFSEDPVTTLKTGLRFTHFVGLALGLGGATLLDLMMLRFCLRGRIQPETYSIFTFSSKIISIGLHILWLSGLGFLFFYALYDLAKLYNPKVHAKIVVVMILMVNGVFIHNVILPTIRNQIGKPLFEGLSLTKQNIFMISGAVSAVSWYVPLALGVFSQFNNSVPAVTILSAYLLLILFAGTAISLVLHLLGPGKRQVSLQPGE